MSLSKRKNHAIDISPKKTKGYIEELNHCGPNSNQIAVIMLGYGFVGKTSVVESLINGKYCRKDILRKTEIKHFKIKHPNTSKEKNYAILNTAPQEGYHLGNSIFFSYKKIFIYVCKPKEGIQPGHDYFLGMIERLSPGSKVILVETHSDKGKTISFEDLRSRYPNLIVAIFNVSNTTKQGIEDLKKKYLNFPRNQQFQKDLIPY